MFENGVISYGGQTFKDRVTSDGLQQLIVRGAGCTLLSARELKSEIEWANERIRQIYQEIQEKDRNYLMYALPPEIKQQMQELIKKL